MFQWLINLFGFNNEVVEDTCDTVIADDIVLKLPKKQKENKTRNTPRVYEDDYSTSSSSFGSTFGSSSDSDSSSFDFGSSFDSGSSFDFGGGDFGGGGCDGGF